MFRESSPVPGSASSIMIARWRADTAAIPMGTVYVVWASGIQTGRGSERSAGLLLRQTVQRPEPPHQVDGVDADDRAVGEQVGKRPERHAVGGVVERRHDHGR